MAGNIVNYIYCLIVLTVCVDRGDGRWKKRDKEEIRHDIDVFKNMAEKIEHEIELFYEDYSDETNKDDDVDKIHKQYSLNRKKETQNKVPDVKDGIKNVSDVSFLNTSSEIVGVTHENDFQHVSFVNVSVPIKRVDEHIVDKSNSPNWPKFEDILLEMGKRYDWKNDRWIKVKRKIIASKMSPNKADNSIAFHKKHKFSYKLVKLNRKSRRNVVIAVSAVR